MPESIETAVQQMAALFQGRSRDESKQLVAVRRRVSA